MREISLNEQKKILVDLLKYIDEVCRKNDIKYSVIGGTAIGAVRHKGFIPWDDDIDIILDHNNYEKLKTILKDENNNVNYKLLDDTNTDNYYPFIKLIDCRTTVDEFGYKKIKDYGIFLDIFEYNKVPNNNFIRKVYYKRLYLWKKIIAGLSWNGERKDHRIILFFRHIVSKIIGRKILIKHYIKLSHKYNNKECKFIMSNWPTYGPEKEVQNISVINRCKDVEFEGFNVMIFEKYDQILKTTFGDYMKLPPKDKRISNHKMKAYWK